MKILLHPAYLPNIVTFAMLVQNEVHWEVHDNFQKQTHRNRTYICTDRGKLMLNIPIKHVGKDQGRQKYKDVQLDKDYNWQRQHWRTLQTAYRTSPFFEYYEDEIAPLYETDFKYLLDYNLKGNEIICNCLQTEMSSVKTETFELEFATGLDARFLINSKNKTSVALDAYNQVFGDRHGFLKNMSVLDLLFNEGTSAMSYLKNIKLENGNA